MKITTKKGAYSDIIYVTVNETETSVKKGEDCDKLIDHLIDDIEELCRLNGKRLIDHLENYYNIKISENEHQKQ
ncbi:hypothetical protein [Chryseobacterium indologenes]|uniref:hypothetical protein n=1 Tax=Chryseobacterium indologenes TaxID=253 RepID=UPI0009A2381E|nr:hypothetical protein [Chryseobacterium indologenes]